MKFKYLGTAAGEWFPAMYCECENCRRARERGGKDIRMRSQAIINSELLIDFSSDTYINTIKNGIDMTKIEHCLITHAHSDHLYVDNINVRKPSFSNIKDRKPLNIYGSDMVIKKIEDEFDGDNISDDNVGALHRVEMFKPFSVLSYEVTPLPALHDKKSGPFIYIIRQADKCMLYGNDTGLFF